MEDSSEASSSSIEYSGIRINWEQLDFEKELEALETSFQIYGQELQSLANNELANYSKQSVLDHLRYHLKDFVEINTCNENICQDGYNVIKEWKTLTSEEELKERQINVEQELAESEKEEKIMRADCKLLNTAYNKAIEKYTKIFDIQVTTKRTLDSNFEAAVKFKSKPHIKPIKLLANRNSQKILEFDASEIFSAEYNEDFMKKYGDCTNIPKMLCLVREYIFGSTS